MFAGLGRQTMKEFQVIIADDGSGPDIGRIAARTSLPFPVVHLWQPDEGFRKNIMLNRAVAAAETDYLVFIDGDCVPHRQFISDHWNNRTAMGLLCGRRVNLGSAMTRDLGPEMVSSGVLEKFSAKILIDGLLARSSNLEDGLRIESRLIRRILHRNRARIVGCNFSVERSWLEKINGFNEDYLAPGLGEDSDVAVRLELLGVRPVPLRYLAVLYHLYHPPTAVGEENMGLYRRTVASRDPVCANGLRKLVVRP